MSNNAEREVLPPYQENIPESSTTAIGPTAQSPFNFPPTELPPYSPTALNQRPIAIPQRWSDPAAPFLSAYSPSLLNYGIIAQTWYSFLDTVSAFQTARVSQRAISHAGDIAAEIGRVPQRLGKEVMADAKATGRNIATNAKNFNPMGVVGGMIGGTIGLTIGTTFKVIGSIFQLPGKAIAAAANPRTPRGRVEMYTAAANRDWFHPRGLHAGLMNTVELTGLIGVSVEEFLSVTETQNGSTTEKLSALRRWIDDLELQDTENIAQISPSDSQGSSATASRVKEPKKAFDVTSASSEATQSSHAESVGAQKDALPAGAIRLSPQTVWLVVFHVDVEKIGTAKGKSALPSK
jgi:hypothetical protein